MRETMYERAVVASYSKLLLDGHHFTKKIYCCFYILPLPGDKYEIQRIETI